MIILSIPLLAVLAVNSCVNINAAPAEELEKIKHIGEARAEQIIKLRSEKLFSSLEELARVPGLGPSRVLDIKKEGVACLASEPGQSAKTVPSPSVLPGETSAEINPERPLGFLFLFLTALIIAIFSGFAILLLKKKICRDIPTPKP